MGNVMDGEYRNLANALILCLIHRWSAGLGENGKSEQSFRKKTFHQKTAELRLKCTHLTPYFTEQ
jgi:hypothetical protein